MNETEIRALKILKANDNSVKAVHSPAVIKESSRSLVARYRVDSGSRWFPTVIFKQLKQDYFFLYNEFACLKFIAGSGQRFAPLCYGVDLEKHFLLQGDLGDRETLIEVLERNNPEEIRFCLKQVARKLAALHLTSIGKEEGFIRLQDQLPVSYDSLRGREAGFLSRSGDRFAYWLENNGIKFTPEIDSCCREAARTYADPGPFLCLTTGDSGLTNSLFGNNKEVLFIDWEYGAYRHAFSDLINWYLLNPLPEQYVRLLNGSYIEEIRKRLAVTEAGCFRDWAYICAFRGIFELIGSNPELLHTAPETELPSYVSSTTRGTLLHILEKTFKVTGGLPELQPLTLALEQLWRALTGRWALPRG